MSQLSLDSAIHQSLSPKFDLSESLSELMLSPNEKRLHFFNWLIFGLSSNLRLGESLSERVTLSQKVQ